jgi:hypothetical protein
MSEKDRQNGCDIHGPFNVCGHTNESCPDFVAEGVGIESEDSKNGDIRDYFQITQAQRIGESIDSNKSHPWNLLLQGIVIKNSDGTIVFGETFDGAQGDEFRKFGLIIVESEEGNEPSSEYSVELEHKTISYINEYISSVAHFLETTERHKFIRKIIENVEDFNEMSVSELNERLAVISLEMFPDYTDAKVLEDFPTIKEGNNGPKELQQKRLSSFFELVSKKMPRANLDKRLAELKRDLYFMQDAFSETNFGWIFSEVLKWVLEDREDVQPDYDLFSSTKIKDYPIRELVRRDVGTLDELSDILKEMPFEPIPDTRYIKRKPPQAELVELDRLVGCFAAANGWQIDEGPGTLRGQSKVFELIGTLQSGMASINDKYSPMKVIEFDGKFYVEGDGRHRAAALKAMRVERAPMLVQHLS